MMAAMQIFQFNRQGERPVRLESVESVPAEGFVWLDFTRQEAPSGSPE